MILQAFETAGVSGKDQHNGKLLVIGLFIGLEGRPESTGMRRREGIFGKNAEEKLKNAEKAEEKIFRCGDLAKAAGKEKWRWLPCGARCM